MKERLSLRPVTLALVAALLGGCASMEEYSCDMHEQQTRGEKPITAYRLVQPKPGQAAARILPAGSIAQVPTYTMSFRPGYTKPCTTLSLHKDVVIYRSNDADVTLNEIREFYAEDGTLIASNTQDITAQVKTSGTYIATTPLPVPKTAPPGKYRIVSKLLFERRHERRPAVQIARAEGFFYIIPRQ